MPTPANSDVGTENPPVMPANTCTDKTVIVTGVTGIISVQTDESINHQKNKKETKRRHRRRSTGEPGEVSAAKKQANNKRTIVKSNPKSTTKPVTVGKHKKSSTRGEITGTTTKGERKTAPLEDTGVTSALSGGTRATGHKTPASEQNELANIPDIPIGATDTLTEVTTLKFKNQTETVEQLAGVTASLSGVTIANDPDNQPNMSVKEVTSHEEENSMLLAIARLETKLLENREKDLNNMEEHLTASMKTIVDSSIQEALKTITCSITKVVTDEAEIKKQKRNIAQLQMENHRLTRKVQVLDSEYNKLKL